MLLDWWWTSLSFIVFGVVIISFVSSLESGPTSSFSFGSAFTLSDMGTLLRETWFFLLCEEFCRRYSPSVISVRTLLLYSLLLLLSYRQ